MLTLEFPPETFATPLPPAEVPPVEDLRLFCYLRQPGELYPKVTPGSFTSILHASHWAASECAQRWAKQNAHLIGAKL